MWIYTDSIHETKFNQTLIIMTNQELFKTLKQLVRQEKYFPSDIIFLLYVFKKEGGKRKTALKFVQKLGTAYQDNMNLTKRTLKLQNVIATWKEEPK